MTNKSASTINVIPKAAPPCPEWCVLPTGHDLDEIATWGYRLHKALVGDIEIIALERLLDDGSLGPLEQPFIYWDLLEEHGSAQDQRKFAAELLRAADRLDEINGVRLAIARA